MLVDTRWKDDEANKALSYSAGENLILIIQKKRRALQSIGKLDVV
jgi:hypothetical protein